MNMKVLDRRELLVSATKEGTSFFLGLLAWKLGKIEVRPFLELFLHTEMAQNFIFDLQSLRSCFQNKRPSASAWC